jgi:ankyrin repeat protein
LLLSHQEIDPNAMSHGQWTILDWALQGGDPMALRLIFQNQRFVPTRKNCGPVWVKKVFTQGNPYIVKELLNLTVVKHTQRDKEGAGPLHWAAAAGSVAVLRMLLEQEGSDVNMRDKEGKTPLHHAVANGMIDTVRLLVGWQGVNVNSEDKAGVGFQFTIHHFDWLSLVGTWRSEGF